MILGFGRQVGRQQRRRQNFLARQPGHRAGGVGAAQHEDHLDVVLEHLLLGALQRLVAEVFVVERHQLDHMRFAADVYTARRVDLLDPDLAAVEAGQAPGRDLAGQRRVEADLDRFGAEAGLRRDARRRDACGGRGDEFPAAQSCRHIGSLPGPMIRSPRLGADKRAAALRAVDFHCFNGYRLARRLSSGLWEGGDALAPVLWHALTSRP